MLIRQSIDVHCLVQRYEFFAAKDAVAINVSSFEQIHELCEELLVLTQLEVQDGLNELVEAHFVGDDLGRLEAAGSSSLGLWFSALFPAVSSILSCK